MYPINSSTMIVLIGTGKSTRKGKHTPSSGNIANGSPHLNISPHNTSLIYILPRSYRDALEAGIFTEDPADLFDEDVCVVSLSLMA